MALCSSRSKQTLLYLSTAEEKLSDLSVNPEIINFIVNYNKNKNTPGPIVPVKRQPSNLKDLISLTQNKFNFLNMMLVAVDGKVLYTLNSKNYKEGINLLAPDIEKSQLTGSFIRPFIYLFIYLLFYF